MAKQGDRENNEVPRTLWLVLGFFLLFSPVSKRCSPWEKERLKEMSLKVTAVWSRSKDVSQFGDEENP